MSRPGLPLATDRRGRVPFAVVGVLLLVASLALAPTLSTEPAPSETAVERTLTEVTAASQTAVRDGVATAGRRAAAAPVVEPADTPVGRALSDDEPFRDSLRLRVYLRARANLDRLSARSDGVETTASLPAVDSTAEYERAIDRVTVERAGENGTALRVTVSNITLTTRRGGAVVNRRTVSPTVVVPTPVLYAHDRTETYETRLTNGLARPGLSRRLTARLYPIAWARGYAQFGGGPVGNVVANRHVSLATNGALLGVQRAVFGRSDPEGRQALTEATAAVGVRDVVATTSNGPLADRILRKTDYRPASQNISTGGASAPQPDDPTRIGINGTADDAFRGVGMPDALNATARDAYTVEAKVVTEREQLGGGRPDRPDPPGPEWQFIDEEESSSARVVGTDAGGATVPDGWHAFERFGHTVEITRIRVARWKRGNANRRTRTEQTERVRVRVALVGDHRNESLAPVRGIRTAHDRSGSPLDGENLADVEPTAESELLPGGHEHTTKQIALERFEREPASITGARPDSIHVWIATDLRALRERVRDIAVTTDRGAVGSFQTNPAKRLRGKLRQRRAQLVDAPETYDSAADRARVAARVAFLDAVERRLDKHAQSHSKVKSGVNDRLGSLTGGSLAALRRGLTARETRVPRTRPVPSGPAGPVRTRVEAQPQYLTLASVGKSRVPALNGTEHPLVARNVNVFSVPYGNAVTAVLDGLNRRKERAGLAAAAKTLAAANETRPPGENPTLDRRRERLQSAVARSNGQVIGALRHRVSAELDADGAVSERLVGDAMARWGTTAARGVALANDSAAERIAALAQRRRNLSTLEADWLRLRLVRTATTTLDTARVRPPSDVVNRTANAVRTVARNELQTALADRAGRKVETLAEKRLGTRILPSGLPLAPPAPWYATTNIWWVTVEGEYARFAVTANHGPPGRPGATVTYAREDEAVTLDADGDGTAERLGANTRLSVRADTGVVIVVPPKPRGVGDKDGNSVESSAGWPGDG
ncbi:hypothetical protein NDI56_00705 [Haloarcula sp. S1CR25-12]|uniref:Uncharacterized protein n=1 Tax=Haloarcula saliterrae TaxID=2950534 RepID=A0ABU2F6N0_9EURY|nr:hypothetical protein [Haloarcula sp. S1CR25-12]MDS0257922.1 hypothetical protein [Haloarcula sp. S1CR25-12]